MILVLVGPSGSGKTAVGQALAAALGWPFLDADDLHDAAARAKMASGTPLDDADRAPWLARVAHRMAALAAGGPGAVVACSALRRAYRDTLRAAGADVRFVLLDADAATLRRRVADRRGHFMPASLVASQLATLERADDLIAVDAARPIDQLVAEIRARAA
ncbi:MAG TPA: gluconokinase, GntK/IdnK-type [Kofleriaceae bacterium]|nr:gluconokinase, GntK/IdnK-type [Kofleriaceae bacterium]